MPNKAKRFLSELPGGDEGFLYKNIASLAACEGARFLLLDREMFTVPRTYLLPPPSTQKSGKQRVAAVA
jgi:hypothetical protein